VQRVSDAEQPMGWERIRVAVADDDAAVREALSRLLLASPHVDLVGVAADADEALEVIVTHQPDVALVDVRMPCGGGPRVTRLVNLKAPQTRVIALSAHDDRGTVLEMLQAGAAGYVAKGTPAPAIIEAIMHTASGQTALSPEVSTHLVRELAERLERDEAGARHRRETMARIQHAIASGLHLVYQPICDLGSGAVVGYEALARFHGDPTRRPERWFADAEEVDLHGELERRCLALLLDEIPRLPGDAFVGVNLSPQSLFNRETLELLAAASCPRLVLELTEHAPVSDYEGLSALLAPLRAGGLRLAVDDAGAGFASLRHILRLAPDHIKLDRSITRGLADDRAHRALAAALIRFAAEIGADIVAEGIENHADLRVLRDLGARFGQGHHLGRPGPPPRFVGGRAVQPG
jgi:EAL domain-containing protein (putative c-di-GMP-specific phosphodiesterase class I)/CheY-like chemotaxis protein